MPKENSQAEVYQALREGLWNDRHVISTDGSRTEGDGQASVGAAWYDSATPHTAVDKLPALATVYLAEAYYYYRHGNMSGQTELITR